MIGRFAVILAPSFQRWLSAIDPSIADQGQPTYIDGSGGARAVFYRQVATRSAP